MSRAVPGLGVCPRSAYWRDKPQSSLWVVGVVSGSVWVGGVVGGLGWGWGGCGRGGG